MEKIKQLLRKFAANPYVRTLVLAFGITVGLIIILMITLNLITRHGQTYAIPDFRNKMVDDLPELVEQADLRLVISDSVYIFNKKPGIVIDQNPQPGTHVKKNRKVFITINARNPIKVAVPDLIDYTLRQAKAIIEQEGFEVGRLSFRPDLGINMVLEQRYRGKPIEPGVKIPKGSRIDLVLGKGMRGERTGLPLLIGLKLNEAKNRIIEASLNLGKIHFDETIKELKDSLDARVYSQYPAYTEDFTLSFGTNIDLWLTLNQSRIPKIRENKTDSLQQSNSYSNP